MLHARVHGVLSAIAPGATFLPGTQRPCLGSKQRYGRLTG